MGPEEQESERLAGAGEGSAGHQIALKRRASARFLCGFGGITFFLQPAVLSGLPAAPGRSRASNLNVSVAIRGV